MRWSIKATGRGERRLEGVHAAARTPRHDMGGVASRRATSVMSNRRARGEEAVMSNNPTFSDGTPIFPMRAMTTDNAVVEQIRQRVLSNETELVDESSLRWYIVSCRTLLNRLARLQEQVKGVACEVCWTTSWTPIEKVEDANGVNTKLYGKTLTRCGYCWREKIYTDRLAAVEKERDSMGEIGAGVIENLQAKLEACEARRAGGA